MSKQYIAYGSNLNIRQMRFRCPTARIICSGIIRNWKLVFRGSKTGAYCTIIKSIGDCVPVLIWKIEKTDEYMLDRYEGFPRFYYKKTIQVETTGGNKRGMVYIMNDMARPGIPDPQYVSSVLTGYLDNDLDLSYLMKAIEYNKEECIGS